MTGFAPIVAVVGATLVFLFVFFVFMVTYVTRYRKVGPNEALIITGCNNQVRGPKGRMERVGHRIVKGGGTFVWPVFEKAQSISLELFDGTFSVSAGERTAAGSFQAKVSGEDAGLRAAAECLMGKSTEEIRKAGLEILEGRLRTILESDPGADRGALESKVRGAATEELYRIGLEMVSFSVKELRDA